MGAYGNIDNAVDGLIYGVNDTQSESAIAKEDIKFGKAVFGHTGFENQCYGAHGDRSTLTLSGALVTSNVFTTTINGIVVATTFSSTSDAQVTAHIAAINADAGLIALGITASAGSTTLKIVLKSRGLDIVATGVVTLGSGQATVAVVVDTWAQFLGVAQFTQRGGRDYGAGSSLYLAGDSVNIISLGTLYVPTGVVTISALQAAYVVLGTGTTQGDFTNVSTNNFDCKSYFRTNSLLARSVLAVRLGITP